MPHHWSRHRYAIPKSKLLEQEPHEGPRLTAQQVRAERLALAGDMLRLVSEDGAQLPRDVRRELQRACEAIRLLRDRAKFLP